MTYFLIIALVAVIAYHFYRMKQLQPHKTHRHQEPAMGLQAQDDAALMMEDEPTVSEVRVVRKNVNHTEAPETIRATEQYHAAAAEPQPIKKISNLITVFLFAENEKPYKGYELLQALLTAGLRYGKRGVFHRYEEISGRGDIIFNLASAVEPGVFDLPKMGGFSTPGLVLFMDTSKVKKPLEIYDTLLKTAKEITADLGGVIYDELRQPLTAEKILAWRAHLQQSENVAEVEQ